MSRLFLIDYENVNSAGLRGIGQAAPNDRIILFYSHAANTLSFEIMDEMMAANITPERICLEHSGKNALDFQLVTFLGYLIAKNIADEYFIISKDAGYQAAIAFCKEYFSIRVQLRPSIKSAIGKQTAQKKQPALPPVPSAPKRAKGKPAAVSLRKKATVIQLQPAAQSAPAAAVPRSSEPAVTLDVILSLIEPRVSAETAEEILYCLRTCGSKTEFHNALQQRFDNDSVKQYYHCLKPCYASCLPD